jgi:Secretion system C-terminal sorting domain
LVQPFPFSIVTLSESVHYSFFMKIFLFLLLFFFAFKNQIYSQNEFCNNAKPLDIKILDRLGFLKISNFCEGEQVTLTTVGDFDRYIWELNSLEGNNKISYFTSKSPTINVSKYLNNITLTVFKKGDLCYTKNSISISPIFTKRELFLPDSVIYGQKVTIKPEFVLPDDFLYLPRWGFYLYNSTEYVIQNFNSNDYGNYKLSNNPINSTCGESDVNRQITFAADTLKPEITISDKTNLNFCPNWLLELNFKAKNLKVVSPKYKLYLATESFVRPNQNYQEIEANISGNSIIFRPYSTQNQPLFVFVKELNSGATSNMLGPFNRLFSPDLKPDKKALEIIKAPKAIIAEGEETEFTIKVDDKSKTIWYDEYFSTKSNQNNISIKIDKSGTYSPNITFTGECYLIGDVVEPKKVSIFENLVPFIKVSTSCEKQAHIELILDHNINAKGLVNIKWKKEGKIISETNDFGFLATEFGNYSCEVWYKDKFIESNTIKISEFKNYQNRLDLVSGSPDGTPCTFTINQIYTYFNTYLFAAKFQWYINDELQENTSHLFTYPKDKINDNTRVKVLYKEGFCEYTSGGRIMNKIVNINANLPKKYEYCSKIETSIIRNKQDYPYPAKVVNNWYKNGELFSTYIQPEGQINNKLAALKTKESGNYHLATLYENINNNTNCTVVSDTFEVVFRNEATQFSANQFTFEFCPTIPKIALNIESNSVIKIDWLLNDSPIEQKNIQNSFSISENKVLTKALMTEPGIYQLKITYDDNCLAFSEKYIHDGSSNFDLRIFAIDSNFCEDTNLAPKSNWDNQNINFTYVWKHNGETIDNETNANLFPKQSGIYEVFVRHETGNCILKSKSFQINKPKINKNLNFSDSTTFCTGANPKVSLVDSNLVLIYWNKENVAYSPNEQLSITKSGNYQAIFRNNFCPNDYYYSNTQKINEIPQPTATISGSKSIDYNQQTDLKFELTSAPPWQIKLNTGEEFSINESPYTLKVRPLSDMKYSINSVENICGLGTTSGEAVIKVTILAGEKSIVENAKLRVFPIPVKEAFELEILETNEKNAQIMLLNNLGVVLQNHFTKSTNNKISKSLNINNLPAGIYNLKIQVGNKIYTKKIVKQ